MTIFYKDTFKKSYRKRIAYNAKLNRQLRDRIALFETNPRHSLLKTHKLTGNKEGFHAFSVTGNLRVIFYQEGEDYFLVDIGSHNQVY